MLQISRNGNVRVSKGDTFDLPVEINININNTSDTPLTINPTDIIYFRLFEANAPWDFPLVKKNFTGEDVDANNTLVVGFTRTDTVWLYPGTYYYEVKVCRPREVEFIEGVEQQDTYITVIPRRKFILQ